MGSTVDRLVTMLARVWDDSKKVNQSLLMAFKCEYNRVF